MEGSKPGDGGVFIFLPNKITKKIYSWQSRFKEYVRMPKPHLTIMYPPYVSKDRWPGLRPQITDIARSIRPFTVDFKSTGYFSDPFFLYIRPGRTKELDRMNEKLAGLLKNELTGLNLEPFIPHVSIGNFSTEETTCEAQILLEELIEITDLQFTAGEICYTVLGDDFRWKIHDIISLGS